MKKNTILDKENNAIVAQNNELVTATYELSVDEFRLLTLMLSKVEQRQANPGWFDVYPIEFKNMFDVNPKNIWRSLKSSAKSLAKKQITFHRISNNDREEFTILNWLSGFYYVREKGELTSLRVKLNSDLDPFLFNISSNFAYCFMNAISKVTNVMAFRLYLYVLSHKNHPACKKNDHCEVYISIDDFRSIFPKVSRRFADIKRFTIEPAIRDINANTDLSIFWKPIKTGKSVTGIKFIFIEEKSSSTKPLRPRLHRRPQVTKDSHLEGEWMKKNAEILYQYEKDLKKYDPSLSLTMPDLRRAVECSKYCKQNWHEEKKRELAIREGKNTKISVAKSEQNKDITFSEKDLELIQNL